MSSLAFLSSARPSRPPRAARRVLSMLDGLTRGSLQLTLPDGTTARFGADDRPAATLRARDWEVFGRLLAAGDAAFAQDWRDGRWDTDTLPALLGLLAANRGALERLIRGSMAGRLVHAFRHRPRRDAMACRDPDGDAHRLWLDPTLSRSSAWWPQGQEHLGLEDAQRAKLDRVLAQLDLRDGGRLLETGCGWGALTEVAARRGLHPTALASSPAELAFVQGRLREAGLSGKADLRPWDGRAPRGQWDGIASIETFGTMGERQWPAWFDRLRRDLAPGGRAVVQTVVAGEPPAGRHRSDTGLAWRHAFPGAAAPTKSGFETLARRHGFAVIDRLDLGRDGARTFALWHEALLARLDVARARGMDTRVVRPWMLRLACREAAFAHGDTDAAQYTLLRAG